MAKLQKKSCSEPGEHRVPPEFVPRMDETRPRPVPTPRHAAQSTQQPRRWSERALSWMGLIAVVLVFGLLIYLTVTGDIVTQVIAIAILAILVSALGGTAVYALNQTEL